MYIADSDNDRVRKVTVSTGIISTVAGTGTGSYSGDDRAATSATLNTPTGIALDSAGTHYFIIYLFISLFALHHLGNIYIADDLNGRIRKVTISTGIITTIAGSSTSYSYSGDNSPATSAGLGRPMDVSLDSAGIVSYLKKTVTLVTLPPC